MLQDILIPMLAVGLAELGDKTQIAVFCLSSQTKKYLRLFLGVMLGFALTDGLAIVLGDFITRYVPENMIKIIAGIIFIIFGVMTLASKKKEEDAKCELKKPFASGFLMILMCEMGDKTQIASGLFATEYNPWLVFAGVMTALSALSLMALYLGRFLTEKIDKNRISMIAGGLFIVIGIWTLVGTIR